jgi:hypothetical protein
LERVGGEACASGNVSGREEALAAANVVRVVLQKIV